MFVIFVRGKEGTAQRFEFDQAVVTIGRSEVNDIVLPATNVSKRHAHLVRSEEGFVLSDRQSTNGTYVNGRKLLAPLLINETDHIHVGDFVLTVALEELGPIPEEPSGTSAEAALVSAVLAGADAPLEGDPTDEGPSPAVALARSALSPRAVREGVFGIGTARLERDTARMVKDPDDGGIPEPVVEKLTERLRTRPPLQATLGHGGNGSNALSLLGAPVQAISVASPATPATGAAASAGFIVEGLTARASARSPSGVLRREEMPVRAGAARTLRLAWLDEWLGQGARAGAGLLRALEQVRGPILSSAATLQLGPLLLHARMPSVVPPQRAVPLRLWATPAGDGAEALRAGLLLEIHLSFPDGGIEALDSDRGVLLCPPGDRSAELALRLRGQDPGAARVEIAVSHRGARVATLLLRTEVRAPAVAVEPNVRGDIASEPTLSELAAQAPLCPLPGGQGPHLVLRLAEGVGLHGANSVPDLPGRVTPSSAASPTGRLSRGGTTDEPRSARSPARSRRLRIELAAARGEWTELLAEGELTMPVPLQERMRALYGSPEVEQLGGLRASAREAALRAIGEELSALLLPEPVREVLGAMPAGALLQIDTAETWVPWELLRCGRGPRAGFLGELFALARSGLGSGVARFARAPRLLVAPPTGAGLRREQQALGLLDPRLLRASRLSEIQPHLQEPGIAGWHITGHGAFDRGDRSAALLHLQDGALTPAQFAPAQRFLKLGMRPPLSGTFVFLGVCEREAPRLPLQPAGVASWIERLQVAGAGAVLATTWPVTEETAAHFAEVFYHAFSQGQPLAVAVAAAREAIRAEGDPSWLSFAAFGLCAATLAPL